MRFFPPIFFTDNMKVPLSYTMELGRDDFNSFAVPLEYLELTVKKGWTAY